MAFSKHKFYSFASDVGLFVYTIILVSKLSFPLFSFFQYSGMLLHSHFVQKMVALLSCNVRNIKKPKISKKPWLLPHKKTVKVPQAFIVFCTCFRSKSILIVQWILHADFKWLCLYLEVCREDDRGQQSSEALMKISF